MVYCATNEGKFGHSIHSCLSGTVSKLRALTGNNVVDDLMISSPDISGRLKMRLNGDRASDRKDEEYQRSFPKKHSVVGT